MTILTDSLHKIAYATDASVYREIPYGVAYPSGAEDIRALLTEARRRGTNLIARAGGTSIAGQVVGNGIVADVSRHMNRILEINAEERYAWVEPGVVRDELNLACQPYGLFFSPETSTSNRCCIGGMVGNNSCGTHSLVYGSTRPHVIEADGILSDGGDEHFADYSIAELEERFGKAFWQSPTTNHQSTITNHQSPIILSVYSQLIRWALDPSARRLIADTYPDAELTRRSCGYAIDEVIADLCDERKPWPQRTINLCRLIAGSEGTLAFLYRIKVSLDPLPPKEGMVVCAHCTTLDAAFEANLIALRHRPTAIELMDGEIIALSRQHAAFSGQQPFIQGSPAALLISELRAETREAIDRQAAALEKELMASGLVTLCTRVYGKEVSQVWNLRKAGLGILNGMKGDAKPTGVIEDTAVAPARLPAYMKDFRKMLERLGTSCVFYGHISTGELHLRPILNLKTAEGKALFRRIAHETTLLVRQHRGTISGEHGDGRLRGEFIPLQYGDATYEMMRQVKYCWDPEGLFNPHKIVDTPRMDESLRADRSVSGNDLLCRVEQCNGAGDCRKSAIIGGTMCPAYKVSRDELQTTRARANLLREYLQSTITNHQSPITNADLTSALTSCLACKACQKECPSGVDMTRLRAEVLQALYDRQGTPLRTWMVAHNADIQRLGALMPHVYNWFASNRFTSSLLKKIMGFAPERKIPKIINHKFEILNHKFETINHTSKKVYLFLDEFTRYQEPELAETFIRLLNGLGYEVIIPKHTDSGRAAVSKGCLRYARRLAEKNVRLLQDLITDETPLVGIEPSCILTFRDEYPDLVAPEMREAAERLSANCLLYDEFLMREVKAGRIRSEAFSDMQADIWLHGHCHQKALVGVEQTAALLALPKNATVHVIPSGCCGMAGSFGYEQAHYKTSLAIGEMVLFPTIRQISNHQSPITNHQSPVTFVAAPGISCRTQIKDGTGITAHHPIELLYVYLRSGRSAH